MSWSVAHSYRFNTVSHAVAVALLCTCGTAASLTAQAATLGAVQVHSAQNEPLSASISVSDVDVAHFSAYLAGNGLYQEMGLTPDPTINARFVADSLTHGRIVLSSTQPIAMPFADVVLTLNNNGDRDIVPKTLLMPLVRPALMQTPLMVQNSAPPPLRPSSATPAMQPATANHTQAPLLAQNMPTAAPLSVVVTDTMPPMPSATKSVVSDAPLLAQKALMQTPLSVIKTAAMPPMPSAIASTPVHRADSAPTLLAQQSQPQTHTLEAQNKPQSETAPITLKQPVRLDKALDTVLSAQATPSKQATAAAQLIHQPLHVQKLTALPALPSSQALITDAPLLAKAATKDNKIKDNNDKPQVELSSSTQPVIAQAVKPASLNTVVTRSTTKPLQAANVSTPTTLSEKPITTSVSANNTATSLSAAAMHTPLHIETTRRITRVNLPERPAFLETRDNDIARGSSHDMLNDAMLTDLADSSRTVARSQTTSLWQDPAHHRAAPLIKNQKAIELEAHLQELRN